MSDFEKETAKKIKEQLAEEKRKQEESEFYGVKMSDEENNVVEQQPEQSVNESETSEVVEESKQESVVENPEQSSILDDPLSGKKRKKSKGILSAVFGIEKAETEHFKRKEKIRPIALIYSILSFLICAGMITAAVFAVIALVKPFWGAIVSLSGVFFTDKVLVFSLGLGWVFGGVLVIALVGILAALIGFFVTLSTMTISIPIVGFKNMQLPKHVFAYEKDSKKNMIFAYIVGVLVSFLGFAMFMDGSYPIASWIVFIAGIIFLAVAILITIDIIQGRKAFKNFTNEQEKQEIKEEARIIESNEKAKTRNKKFIGKLLSKMIGKK